MYGILLKNLDAVTVVESYLFQRRRPFLVRGYHDGHPVKLIVCTYVCMYVCISLCRRDIWFDDVDIEEIESGSVSSSSGTARKKKFVTGDITEYVCVCVCVCV